MLKTAPINKIDLEAENEKLKAALRTVFLRQKNTSEDLDELKSEYEKLNSSVRKQATTIPELQMQNRVLQQQLKTMIQDLHFAEKNQEELFEKLKLFQKKLIAKARQLKWTRAILYLTFISTTGLIWQTYREKETNHSLTIAISKAEDENDTLHTKNKMLFDDRETFQSTIDKRQKEQFENLSLQLATTTNEKLALHSKLSQAIDSFKQQKNELDKEQKSLLNLVKNSYENKFNELAKEKIAISNQLAESELKSREIVLKEPVIQEPKHSKFLNVVQKEIAEKPSKNNDQKTKHQNN